MKWILLSESYIPNGIEIIKKSFNNDYTYEKFTPTIEFLEEAYGYLNNRLFQGKLPEDIEFKIEHSLEDNDAGHTYANDNKKEGEFVIDGVSLNGTLMMTIHSWLETILHEMIHVMDFKFHPEHFNKKINPNYDYHKGWFMKEADKFKKYGFDIKETIDSDVETTTDDDSIKEQMNGVIYIKLGYNPIFKCDTMIKIHSLDKNSAFKKLKSMGCSSIDIISTKNLSSTRLKTIELDDIGQQSYRMTDKFNDTYGPFTKVETIDLMKTKFNENSTIHHRKIILEDGSEDITYLYPGLTSVIRLPNGRLHIKT